jgi:hypothetical protein
MRADGSIISSMPGDALPYEHGVSAFIVSSRDAPGKGWALGSDGTIEPVGAAAMKVLSADEIRDVLVLDTKSAILGCVPGPDDECIAEQLDLDSGSLRTLFSAQFDACMGCPPSITSLDASRDLQTVWFRELPRDSGGSVVTVDLRTGHLTRRALPIAILGAQSFGISRDGKWFAGEEYAGVDSTKLITFHMHVVALDSAVDSDVQGIAPYTLEPGRTVAFSPDTTKVMWWGGLEGGSVTYEVNVAVLGHPGKNVYGQGSESAGFLGTVVWLDSSRLVARNGTGSFTIDIASGAIVTFPDGAPAIIDVLD